MENEKINKVLVGETVKLYAEVKDFDEGQGVTFTVRNAATGEAAAVLGAEVKDGRAEAEWKSVDTRRPDDTGELKYFFEVTAPRCRTVRSGDIQVKNPRVLSMEWDKKAIYYGDKATLRIKTFELSDEKPTCKLVLFDEYFNQKGDFIFEQEIELEKEDLEQEIEFNFSLRKFDLTRKDLELRISTNLLDENNCILNKESAVIRVGVGFAYE